MKIYKINYITINSKEFSEDCSKEEIRAKLMSFFSKNEVVDAIATAHIKIYHSLVEVVFVEPLVIED